MWSIVSLLATAIALVTCSHRPNNMFGLSNMELKSLRDAWNFFTNDASPLEDVKRAMLLMFETNEASQNYFTSIAAINPSDLSRTGDFTELATIVLTQLSDFMGSLTNKDKVVVALHNLKDLFKGNMFLINEFTWAIYNIIQRPIEVDTVSKYRVLENLKKLEREENTPINSRKKKAALIAYKKAENLFHVANRSLIRILNRIDELVSGLVTNSYFGLNRKDIDMLQREWSKFASDRGQMEKLLRRVLQETPEILNMVPVPVNYTHDINEHLSEVQVIYNAAMTYVQLVKDFIDSLETFEKFDAFIHYLVKAFGSSKLNVLKKIKTHIVK
ncbi:uncharacterized protein [Periplaneta americana]|uniref:uncharacterized protein isoform X2 n=1 Tax=Periplaneta americana TaxID=6978 RepID=UPI0037E9BCD2